MTTVSYSPGASQHDASQGALGVMEPIGGASVIIGADAHWGGLWVDATADIATLAGATINSAYLNYYPINTSRDDPDVIWSGEDVDTAAVFAGADNNISDRTLTTASAADSATGVGTGERSIDITDIIQEIVERPGWTGPIVLIGDGQSGSDLRFTSYDAGGNVWSIDIDYTAGGAPVALDGTSAATSGATGALSLAILLTGISAATSGAAADLTVPEAGGFLLKVQLHYQKMRGG